MLRLPKPGRPGEGPSPPNRGRLSVQHSALRRLSTASHRTKRARAERINDDAAADVESAGCRSRSLGILVDALRCKDVD
ncbi:hypothetical protein AAFF_G00333930 [Aldrovandia affinis]|uniref:Uncharacterized protein n=1 Tax=Aldrovandia affinis TaxID=143900 RepID=A0AAD7R672_9TELE|nr:hypothetical protein AAFF_G00333930 [Aldrovandia affinis]